MQDPRKLRQEAARARAEALRLSEYAAALDTAADALSTTRHGYGTVTDMESTTVTDGRRGPAAKNGPAADAAKAAGLVSLEALAEALGEKPGTVRQWNKRRSIPKRAKARLDGLIEKRQGSKK